MKTYGVLLEFPGNNWGAWAPDLPGCLAVGDTLDDCIASMREAIRFHLEGMAIDGVPITEPVTRAVEVQVRLPDGARQSA